MATSGTDGVLPQRPLGTVMFRSVNSFREADALLNLMSNISIALLKWLQLFMVSKRACWYPEHVAVTSTQQGPQHSVGCKEGLSATDDNNVEFARVREASVVEPTAGFIGSC